MKRLILFVVALTSIIVGAVSFVGSAPVGVAVAVPPPRPTTTVTTTVTAPPTTTTVTVTLPPVTVTETTTATVTTTAPPVTVTETVTAPPTTTTSPPTTTTPPPTTTTPPPTTTTTPPPPTCSGTNVAPGSGLKAAMDAAPAGTTFCLGAGTYTVNNQINTQDGDKVFGAGRDTTFIDGSGLPPTQGIIFRLTGANQFRDFDISGAPTPPAGGTSCDNPATTGADATWCGQAFRNYGNGHTFTNIDCHDNGANCMGGNASMTITGLDCWNNGDAYSNTSSFRYAACIKQAAAYGETDNDVTMTGSTLHDNNGTGLWCDFCKNGTWDIHGNSFLDNDRFGLQWEMSGGWTDRDNAHVYNNVFHGNFASNNGTVIAGLVVSTANDIIVEDNTFGNNFGDGIRVLFSATRNPPQPDSRGTVIRNNTMNGDAVNGCGLAGVTCSNNT